MKKLLITICLLLTNGCTAKQFSDTVDFFLPDENRPTYDETIRYRQKLRDEEIEKEQKEIAELEKYRSYVNKHSSEHIKKLVAKNQITIGMTQEEVIASQGKPLFSKRTIGDWGIHEQWVYGYSYYNGYFTEEEHTKYLYFENGILTAWQD